MNKKIFTLLASSLMLFMAVFTVNAQVPITGDTVDYLPKGVGRGAYHLHLTYVGDSAVTYNPITGAGKNLVLASDSAGYLYFEDVSNYGAKSYRYLREALWCVDIRQEKAGQVPAYVFTNKEYAWDLSVESGRFTGTEYPVVSDDGSLHVRPQVHGNGTREEVLLGGEYMRWAFSRTYNTVPLEKHQFLRLEINDEPDYFLTFATVPDANTPGNVQYPVAGIDQHSIRLVKVHANDFKPTSDVYQYLLRFTLVKAGPRVLSANDFNTRIGQQTIGKTQADGGIDLIFDPNATKGNPFADNKLWASRASGSGITQYLYIQDYASKDYVTVLDGDKEENYWNQGGTRFPIISTQSNKAADGRNEFRFVYYPSEDSLIINALRVNNKGVNLGVIEDLLDNGASYVAGQDYLYSSDMSNYLIVRLQDLDDQEKNKVITVYNRPANVRAHFGLRDCEHDNTRTTIESGLYTIRDKEGRYLVVELGSGDYTPSWKDLKDGSGQYGVEEVAFKTPSYQWMVTKINKDSKESRIHLTNRELDNVRIEYVQIHDTWTLFTGYPNYTGIYNQNAEYEPALNKKYVNASSFIPVVDDKEAAAVKKSLGSDWMQKMPQDLLQKLYRTNPLIGYKYIDPDTLNYYGYALKYETFIGYEKNENFYIGLKDDKNDRDSMLHIDREPTYFEFLLPDSLKKKIGGAAKNRPTEKYGIGYDDNLLKDITSDKKTFDDPASVDYIAKLERSYYYLMVNDYWRYNLKRNEQFVVVDDNARYSFTDETVANARQLNKAKFYLRYDFERGGEEAYVLLDRIDKANFHYLTDKFDWTVLDTLKTYDISHGSITTDAFGVTVAQVDEKNDYVRMVPKNIGTSTAVSGFTLHQINEPLYRRFNVAATDDGEDEDDTPRLLKFYDYTNPQRFLYEDAHSSKALPYDRYPKINYLGIESEVECQKAQANGEGHWHESHNYIIYVDTAYVNRGTGWIKPQYLLVMDPKISELDTGRVNACGDPINVDRYIYGRYLINATDSAREKGFLTASYTKPRDEDYIWGTTWERLAFVDAIHMNDYLYILKGHNIEEFYAKCFKGDEPDVYLSISKLQKAVDAGQIDAIFLGNNLHKDVVFSMRFVERQMDNQGRPTGNPINFYIESETTNRSTTEGRMIAPMHGGWVALHNEVPVISRGSFTDPIIAPQAFDVFKAGTNNPEDATSNDDVVAVKVIAGTENVTILNAAGKRVVISNILGQTVANTVLNADNVTIPSPKGVVVVVIEGEDAVKAVVK